MQVLLSLAYAMCVLYGSRYYKDSAYVIIPVDKDKDPTPASCQAISALANALHNTGKLGGEV
jgi:hypothetical protein